MDDGELVRKIYGTYTKNTIRRRERGAASQRILDCILTSPAPTETDAFDLRLVSDVRNALMLMALSKLWNGGEGNNE